MTGWKIKQRPVITCSMIKEPDVYLERKVIDKINLLMNEYPHQEWLGYLVGDTTEEDNFLVEDLIIPPHASAVGGSAEAEPFHIPERCVGLIHSHHSMGAFHSGTDQTHVDRNYPLSITVAKKQGNSLEYDTISCKRTECNKDAVIKGHIKYVSPKPEFDTTEWLETAKSNIDKGKKAAVYQGGYYYSRDDFYNDRDMPPMKGQQQFKIYNELRVIDEEDEVLEGKDGCKMSITEIRDVTKDIWDKEKPKS